MALFGPPRPGFAYPRITYGTTILDFEDPVTLIRLQEMPISQINVAENGAEEVLYVRTELRITLSFLHLEAAMMRALYTWWSQHAAKRLPSALVLDRFGTCAGQWEYDQYNTTFSQAILLNNPFAPVRSLPRRSLYTVELAFRQGVV